jgi:hypothetical protein
MHNGSHNGSTTMGPGRAQDLIKRAESGKRYNPRELEKARRALARNKGK